MPVELGISICVLVLCGHLFYIHSAPHAFSTGIKLQDVARLVESDLPREAGWHYPDLVSQIKGLLRRRPYGTRGYNEVSP